MKALTLWQPWASAIALGSKRIETRSWSTKYRGPLAIHAASRCHVYELIHYCCTSTWRAALRLPHANNYLIDEHLPFGAIVAICELTDCRPTESFTVGELDFRKNWEGITWCEREMGDFAPGRFGWVLNNIQPLKVPIIAKGFQQLWNWNKTEEQRRELLHSNP